MSLSTFVSPVIEMFISKVNHMDCPKIQRNGPATFMLYKGSYLLEAALQKFKLLPNI